MQRNNETLVCLDLEGVLVPEMWPHIAISTGINELQRTTREEEDYPKLVTERIKLLKQHNITSSKVNHLMLQLDLLPGALDFITKLRHRFDVLIVSDAFEPMVNSFCEKLGNPEIECNQFLLDKVGNYCNPIYVRANGKKSAVLSAQRLGRKVIAIGDAFNDLEMLRSADFGFLYKPSEHTSKKASDIQKVNSYSEILELIDLNILPDSDQAIV